MHNSKVGYEGVVHVLPEEGRRVKGVKGDSIRPRTISSCQQSRRLKHLS